MGNFKITPHTADVRLKVEGETFHDLFRAALAGMNTIIKSDACEDLKKATIKREITLSSPDITSLLVDFLSEVLTRTQIDKAVFCVVDFNKLDEENLEATLYGEKVEDFDEDIKAVTYHEADVEKNEEGNLETVIVFDV